jgi:protein gp37
MADHSKIEWTDATWNPMTGCTKVSDGCKHCYAERDWVRLAAPRAKPNVYTGRDFTDVRCHPERLAQPLSWRKPRRIFVNSMSDLFHEEVPDQFIAGVFGVMARTPRHIFQILTKRPERMRVLMLKLLPSEAIAAACIEQPEVFRIPLGADEARRIGLDWPLPNVWLGVSCEDQATADERIPLLLQTPAAVRWISAEPLLGSVDIHRWIEDFTARSIGKVFGFDTSGPCINWVIAGGESGPHARPSHPDWFRSLRDQCQAAGVPFFFKQWGQWAPGTAAAMRDGMARGIPVCGLTVAGSTDTGPDDIAVAMWKLGKKSAGRSLDGRTWDEYPA